MAAMKAVMEREADGGFLPRDVSAQNVGYDIESVIPEEQRGRGPCLRFIEVKGRQKGSTTVTVTRNEILTALNKPEEYILAIVEVEWKHDAYDLSAKAVCSCTGCRRVQCEL